MAAGRFTEFSRGDLVFYVEDLLLDNRMRNVFVQNRQHGEGGLDYRRRGVSV